MPRCRSRDPSCNKAEEAPIPLEWGHEMIPVPCLTKVQMILLIYKPGEAVLIHREVNLKLIRWMRSVAATPHQA